jgi:hypothetical protein
VGRYHDWRAIALVLAAAILTACGVQTSASAKASPTRETTASPTATPQSLNCKLPVFYPPESGTVQGGWATFPAGATQKDASAAFTRSGNLVTSKAQPALSGDGPTFYDRAKSRWIPVGRKAVADDGATYAYMDQGNAQHAGHQLVHLVEVATAHDRTIGLPGLPAFTTWNILEYTGGRIYLIQVGSEGPGPPGLWRLDPGSGQVAKLFDDKTPVALQGQTAWFETVNPADSQALVNQQSGDKLPDQIERRDLQTGATIPAFYRAGAAVQLVGIDLGGHPFVAVSQGESPTDAMEIDAVPAPNGSNRMYEGTVAEIDALSVNFTDQHGTWFGGDHGVYLYSGVGSFRQVTTTGSRPAGRCA